MHSDIPEALQTALAAGYEFEGIVGRGGMATVYLAHDRKHGRAVAIKVLRPELAASLGKDRFLKEIDIAARLTHPHIVPLYDSGEAAGYLFYVMPYVVGHSLRGLLNREERLDLSSTVAITTQVADALGYAHRFGVLHRDIKPENILLSENHAYVVDFGVAKAITTAGGETITRTGFALGTPGYMSPEQAAGVRDLDARTDVYGLACVVYEMLLGDTPGLWPSEEAVRLRRFVDAPAPHRLRLDLLPGRVEQVLVQALAMRPAQRFATPGAFTEALVGALEHEPQYGEAQVRQIIGRAAELQVGELTAENVLSVGAVEQIGAEVGIPPERVREAMAELAAGSRPLAGRESEPMVEHASLDPPARYGDTEVRRIIRRAAELEAGRLTEDGSLSITQLEVVAAEVGIPPERVRQAAIELRQLEQAGPTWSEGPPPQLYGRSAGVALERFINHRVDESQFAGLVEEIRGRLRIVGRVTLLSGALTWSGSASGAAGGRDVLVTITPQADGTAIRIEERASDLVRRVVGSVIGWLGGGLMGMAVALGLGAAETSLVPLFGIGFSAAGAYAVSRSAFVHAKTQRERELRALADRLVALVEQGSGVRSALASNRVD